MMATDAVESLAKGAWDGIVSYFDTRPDESVVLLDSVLCLARTALFSRTRRKTKEELAKLILISALVHYEVCLEGSARMELRQAIEEGGKDYIRQLLQSLPISHPPVSNTVAALLDQTK